MNPYYSIAGLADMFNDHFAKVADALIACGVPLIYEGKPADISRWERIQPERFGGAIFVTTGGVGPSPNPDAVVVSSEALPTSWVQRINALEAEIENVPMAYRRDEPKPMPSTRLVAITELVDKVVASSGGNLSIEEVVSALNRTYDGDSMMIYDGSWGGLKPAIDGDLYKEHSGYNARVDVISDLFNSKYWMPQGADSTFQGTDGRIDAGEIMLTKEDGEILFAAMMDIFHPGAASSNETVEAKGKEKSVPAISGATFDRLQRSIEAFPTRYPDYKSKPPKLDDDVRPWLKESGLSENDAERRVFGAIIREHFKLSPDALKSQ